MGYMKYESKKVNIMPINGDKVLSYCTCIKYRGGLMSENIFLPTPYLIHGAMY